MQAVPNDEPDLHDLMTMVHLNCMTLQRQRRHGMPLHKQLNGRSSLSVLTPTLVALRGKAHRRKWTMEISDEIRVQIIGNLRRIR
jgi:hypothetical protein